MTPPQNRTMFFVKLFLFEILAIQSYILYTCMEQTMGNRLKKFLNIKILSFDEFINILIVCEIFDHRKKDPAKGGTNSSPICFYCNLKLPNNYDAITCVYY